MAHKKAGWTVKNVTDSAWQRLWVKLFWWEKANPWNIIIRQRWTKWHPWAGVQMWVDHTIFSVIDWYVKFYEKKQMKFNWRTYKDIFVSVVEKNEQKEKAVKKSA